MHTLRNPGCLLRCSIELMPFNTAMLPVELLFLVCARNVRRRAVSPGVIVTPEHPVCSLLQRWQRSV
jgi:hypothetical protein